MRDSKSKLIADIYAPETLNRSCRWRDRNIKDIYMAKFVCPLSHFWVENFTLSRILLLKQRMLFQPFSMFLCFWLWYTFVALEEQEVRNWKKTETTYFSDLDHPQGRVVAPMNKLKPCGVDPAKSRDSLQWLTDLFRCMHPVSRADTFLLDRSENLSHERDIMIRLTK